MSNVEQVPHFLKYIDLEFWPDTARVKYSEDIPDKVVYEVKGRLEGESWVKYLPHKHVT